MWLEKLIFTCSYLFLRHIFERFHHFKNLAGRKIRLIKAQICLFLFKEKWSFPLKTPNRNTRVLVVWSALRTTVNNLVIKTLFSTQELLTDIEKELIRFFSQRKRRFLWKNGEKWARRFSRSKPWKNQGKGLFINEEINDNLSEMSNWWYCLNISIYSRIQEF